MTRTPTGNTTDTTTAATLSREAQVRVECVRTMYRQIPSSFVAAMGVTLYLVITMWSHAPHRLIAVWLGAQAVAQAYRFWVVMSARRAELTAENAADRARRYSRYMLFAGVVWGLVPLLFFRAASPLSQVFTMCGLYGITGGAVSGHAHHPPALRAFVVPIFVAAMARMLMMGTPEHITLGVASLFYMLILLAFCRVQHGTAVESIRIRFENVELVEELRRQKAEAEEAKARAEQASLAKSRFLAAASHDLRQPLHALGLFSATLRELALDGRQRGVVEQIYRSIDSLEALFDELLDISKLDAGYIRPSLIDVPVQRVLDALGTRYRQLADAKALAFKVRSCDAAVRTDPALLERVLGNLVANAIRYTGAGGVLVACRRRGASLRIEVWDTGVGIAPDQHEAIFEEFFQIGNPERDRRKGLGLGLAIARRTAALLGSTVDLRSAPGRGSVFRLLVPIGDASALGRAAPEPATTTGAGDALAGRCVVVIDDESSIQDGMRDLLTQWGCAPVVAGSAAEAIALADRQRLTPALVIADYRLRGRATGAEAVALVRGRFAAGLPALLITGDTAPERLAEAQQSGLHVMHKPVRPSQLRALCNYLLTRPRATAEA